MGLKLITAPASPVLTLTEAKAHLRVVTSDDDTIITDYVAAATNYAEEFTGRAFIDQTWDLYLDAFPTTGELQIKIPKPPLIEVLSVSYDDSNGDEQVIASGQYYVDTVSEFGWVVPASGLSTWPTPIDAINSVRVRFRAGYLSPDSPPLNAVPRGIVSAVKLILGSLYEHRESQVVGTISSRLPWGAEQLLRQHRVLLGMA